MIPTKYQYLVIVLFTTLRGKVNMSGNWCYWCDISTKLGNKKSCDT